MQCIKRGTPPDQRVWAGDCYTCNSKFEALEGELVNIVSDPKDHTRMAKANVKYVMQNSGCIQRKINEYQHYI